MYLFQNFELSPQDSKMKSFIRPVATIIIVLAAPLILAGCFHKAPISHIASDISLIIPNQTTKQEILSYMGYPAQKKAVSADEEEWLYYQANNSFLRKTPLVGGKLGQTQYDMAIIRFSDDVVTSSQFRDLTEEEFKQLGISESAPE